MAHVIIKNDNALLTDHCALSKT